jgi:hypothetical protein
MPKPSGNPAVNARTSHRIVSDTKPGRDNITGNATIHGGDFDDHHANRPVEQQAAAHGSGQRHRARGAGLGLPGAGARGGAGRFARNPAPAAAPTPSTGEIVVTGSRITSSGFSAPTPTQVLSAAVIAKSAQPNIFTTIAQLPSLQGSTGATYGTNSTSSGTQGLSSFSLRGLGPIRTLTLLDGQRVVGANVTGVPDISLFPQLLVDRVDVVTGGASASYGSDAVGGVVNSSPTPTSKASRPTRRTASPLMGTITTIRSRPQPGNPSWMAACTWWSAANTAMRTASPPMVSAKAPAPTDATGTRPKP